MPGVSKSQIEQAKAVPLLDYLLAHEGGNFKRIGNAYYHRDPDHNSLSVSNNLWFWHSHGVGGDIIDYFVKINGYSFVDAVRHLAGDDYTPTRPITPKARPPTPEQQTEREPFRPPLRNADNKRVIEYLVDERGLDRPLIEDCIKRGLLYETAIYHNACFVGRDDNGKARFAALRGTMGDFKRDADGNDKRYGFCLPPACGQSDTVMAFESPIDALSHICLLPDLDGWRLSLGGTALAALTRFLEVHGEIKRVIVCTDNDDAGEQAAAKIIELAGERGLKAYRERPPLGKDWNETLLQTQKGNEVNLLEDKRKDIIFRDRDYKEQFRIKDGDSIKVTLGYDGEVVTRKCRWIDERHTKIGSGYYHVDEYAEKSARVGNVTEPVASGKPTIDILAAKYGEELKDVSVPMTEAALRKLVGGKYAVETLRYPNQTNQIKDRIVEIQGKEYGAVVCGAEGIAVCGLTDGVLTSLHPYNAQRLKREMGAAERPADKAAERSAPEKPDFLGKIDKLKAKASDQTPKSPSPNKAQEIS